MFTHIDFLLYSPIEQWVIKDPITLSPSDFQIESLRHSNIKELPCQHPNCLVKIAHFNYPGFSPGLYCAEHKKPTMINVRNNVCRYRTCRKRALFNYFRQETPLLCGTHKLPDMTNLINRNRCQHSSCEKKALFNYPSPYSEQTRGILCLFHKKDGMRLVPNLKCRKSGCRSSPSHISPNKVTYLYCPIHRKGNSINVSSRGCQNYKCQRMASYGYPDSRKPLFCGSHRRSGMTRVY